MDEGSSRFTPGCAATATGWPDPLGLANLLRSADLIARAVRPGRPRRARPHRRRSGRSGQEDALLLTALEDGGPKLGRNLAEQLPSARGDHGIVMFSCWQRWIRGD